MNSIDFNGARIIILDLEITFFLYKIQGVYELGQEFEACINRVARNWLENRK